MDQDEEEGLLPSEEVEEYDHLNVLAVGEATPRRPWGSPRDASYSSHKVRAIARTRHVEALCRRSVRAMIDRNL